MSALQISLIVVAVLAVGGLVLHNWWQERKYRKQWMATFGRNAVQVDNGSPPADVDEEAWSEPVLRESGLGLHAQDTQTPIVTGTTGEPYVEHHLQTNAAEVTGNAARIEPVMGDHHEMTADVETEPLPDMEPPVAVMPEAPIHAETVATHPVELPPAPLDALLEFGIVMRVAEPVAGTAFSALIEQQRAEGRNVRWMGYAELQDKWVEISPWRNQEFTDVLVAVQLADRQGAVSESALRAICEDVRVLAERQHGMASWEDVTAAGQRAARLDRFCVEVDVLIGLNVVSPDAQAFSGATIAEVAQEAGMALDATGVYQRRNERGDVLYTLCNHEDAPFTAEQMGVLVTHGVTLLFEVPRIENGVAVFAEMAKFSQQMAARLGGRLVDDNIRPLSQAGLEKIQTQLVHIYQQMEASQIPAGGRRALRLFN